LKNKKFYIWEGIYNNFKEASKLRIGPGFSGNKWKIEQSKIYKICEKYIKNKKDIPKIYKERHLNLIFVIKIILKEKKRIRILDYGGGFGIVYYILKENFGKNMKNLNLYILEIPSVRKFAKKLNPNISFVRKLNQQKKYNLLYSSSALQYVVNWRETIIKFAKTNSDFIFLSDTFVGNIPTFVSLQNYYNSKIPHWFINFRELNELFKNYGYKLISKKKTILTRLNFKKKIPMQNFKKKYKLTNTINLLYKKNDIIKKTQKIK
jgi:putative methyltransferase (TIGR04325 family)